MSDFDLTDDQKAAMSAFASFMLSDESEMVISGQAGVGKTTLLSYLFRERPHEALADQMNQKVLTQWYFTATTNKAAEVLSNAIGYEATTIHSLLGLRVYNDNETGASKVSYGKDATTIYDAIVVIDEASMADRTLLKFIRQGTMNCKIVFIGDHCQMAPVMEPDSPVFAKEEVTYINQIVRSQGTPAITALTRQLREIVETGTFTPIQEVPGVIDYLDKDRAEQEIVDHFKDLDVDARILCYTNATVIAYNQYIRKLRGLPDELTEGEILISNNAVRLGKGRMLHIEQEVHVQSLDTQTVFQPNNGDTKLDVYGITTNVGQLLVPVNPDEYHAYIKACARAKNWPAYFSLKEQVADLRPRDASTVYKAQGSTYRTVFVNLTDIGRCTNPSQAARMLYVACSRPTHHIKFIGQLPARFRGE